MHSVTVSHCVLLVCCSLHGLLQVMALLVVGQVYSIVIGSWLVSVCSEFNHGTRGHTSCLWRCLTPGSCLTWCQQPATSTCLEGVA